MCVWENAVGVSQKWWMLGLSNLCHCVQHPWKLTSRDFWSSRNERKALSQQKCVLRSNWSLGVHILRDIAEIGWASQNWMNIFSFISSETPEMGTDTFRTVTIVFSTSENLLVGISGAQAMKESHFLNKNVCLRKCCVISQKWWMLELSNLCHCVQHPWKLTNRDYWSPRNKGKQLSKLTHVFRKCSGASQNTVNARAFKPLSLCSAPLKTY